VANQSLSVCAVVGTYFVNVHNFINNFLVNFVYCVYCPECKQSLISE
jgi:hypothetical protein